MTRLLSAVIFRTFLGADSKVLVKISRYIWQDSTSIPTIITSYVLLYYLVYVTDSASR